MVIRLISLFHLPKFDRFLVRSFLWHQFAFDYAWGSGWRRCILPDTFWSMLEAGIRWCAGGQDFRGGEFRENDVPLLQAPQ